MYLITENLEIMKQEIKYVAITLSELDLIPPLVQSSWNAYLIAYALAIPHSTN